jgi:ADP-ribosylglycohydrolase
MKDATATSVLRNRYRGALGGLAVGDAVGTTLEFKPAGTFEPIDDVVGGGPFGLEPGQWTDDTSMVLCLEESLIECGFDPEHQFRRYVRWWREGYSPAPGGASTSETRPAPRWRSSSGRAGPTPAPLISAPRATVR